MCQHSIHSIFDTCIWTDESGGASTVCILPTAMLINNCWLPVCGTWTWCWTTRLIGRLFAAKSFIEMPMFYKVFFGVDDPRCMHSKCDVHLLLRSIWRQMGPEMSLQFFLRFPVVSCIATVTFYTMFVSFASELPIPIATFGAMSTNWKSSRLRSRIVWSPTDPEWLRPVCLLCLQLEETESPPSPTPIHQCRPTTFAKSWPSNIIISHQPNVSVLQHRPWLKTQGTLLFPSPPPPTKSVTATMFPNWMDVIITPVAISSGNVITPLPSLFGFFIRGLKQRLWFEIVKVRCMKSECADHGNLTRNGTNPANEMVPRLPQTALPITADHLRVLVPDLVLSLWRKPQ